jgi:hypothetical protein
MVLRVVARTSRDAGHVWPGSQPPAGINTLASAELLITDC